MLQMMDAAKSLFLFVLAGLCEIGGGYLIWLWLRDDRGVMFALFGALTLFVYGIIPTFQPSNFGRVYAAYGGIFISVGYVESRKTPLFRVGMDRPSLLPELCSSNVFPVIITC